MHRAFFAIVFTTFKEIRRQPSIWIIFIAGILLTLALPTLTVFAIGEEKNLLFSLGISTFELGGLIIAIFGALKAISAEIDNKTILVLMSKPVSRTSLILGKFGGVSLTIFLFHLLISIALIISFYFWHSIQGVNGTNLYQNAGFSGIFNLEAPYILTSAYMLLLQNLILTSALITGSVFLPIIGNSILGIFLFFIGHLNDWLDYVFNDVYIVSSIVNVLPDFQIFDITGFFRGQIAIPFSYLVAGTLACVLYSTLFLLPGIWILNRRDFN